MRKRLLQFCLIFVSFVASKCSFAQESDSTPLFVATSDDLSEFWKELPFDLVRESEPYQKYLSIIEDPQWNLVADSDEKRSGFEWWTDWIDRTQPTLLRAKGFSTVRNGELVWYAAVKFESISTIDFSDAIKQWFVAGPELSDSPNLANKNQESETENRKFKGVQEFRSFEVDGQLFYEFGRESSIRWTIVEDWVCVVSNIDAFKQFQRDMGTDVNGDIPENRRLLRVTTALQRPEVIRVNKGKLLFAADFAAFSPLLKSVLPQETIRSLGINEIVGGGVGIDIIRKSKPARIQIDAVFLTTMPKSGIAKVLDTLEPIASLPPIPEHSFFLGAVNFSPLEAYDGAVELYESIQGEASFLRDLNEIPGGRPDFDLREDLFAGICGTMLSVNILDPNIPVPQRLDAYEVKSDEKAEKVIQALVDFDAEHSRERAMVKTTLSGRPAWFSQESKFKQFADALSGENKGPPPLNSGYVLTDRWAYHGDKGFLESLLSESIDQDSLRNRELNQEMEQFEREIGISPEFIIVAWPEFLRSLSGRQIYRDLDRLYPEEKTRNRIALEISRGGEYPTPETHEQAAYWGQFHLQQALTSLVSRIMLAGQSNGEGLRAQLRIELGNEVSNTSGDD